MPFVYILECSDGTYYTGSTTDLERRLLEHELGGSAYTRERLPVRLVWSEETGHIADAYSLERRLHGWSHTKKEALVAGRIADLAGWSRRQRAAAGTMAQAAERDDSESAP
ncbi:GIY-YIG nuclease family protein [Humibacter albus]|jgi:putative endonuclease|uniref:GIY-YIG nuclease family protein n=1 Tax=Humibacter albus TaxID=427754 RepID=UPI0004217F53|nr:GIY-YIG nuclease family protein [Humibacter albus]